MNPLTTVLLGCSVFFVASQLVRGLGVLVRLWRGQPALTAAHRRARGQRLLIAQLLLLAFMGSSLLAGAWSLADVGPPGVDPLVAFALGAVLYFPIRQAIVILYFLAGQKRLLLTIGFDTFRANYPRSRRQKCMYALGLALNPITEEWLYRGVLVTWLHTLTGSVWIIVAAVLASAVAHSYQKLSAAPFHLLFAAAACGIVLSPLGYLGAVGLHMVGDLYPLATMKDHFHHWKRRVRARQLAV